MRISFILFLFYSSFSLNINAQNVKSFEGIITYKKETLNDTVFNNFYIKGSKIRIDYILKNGKLLKYKVIDLKNNEYLVVNPSKKLYIKSYISKTNTVKNGNLIVDKTGNYKFIQQKKCFQWIVKDKKNNTVVSYWVAYEGYKFYGNLLEILNETEKIFYYFPQINNSNGYIPFLSVERSWLRDERMKMIAEKIIEISIDDSVFDIPEGYLPFN